MSSKNKLLFIGITFLLLVFTSLLLFLIPKVKIEINEAVNMKINIGDEYIEYGAVANLVGIGTKKDLPVEIKGEVDTSLPGRYIITYHTNYKKKSYDAIRMVTVVDLEKPELTINKKITICKSNNLLNIDAQAIDNFDGDITNNIKYKINGRKILVYVEDSSKNRSEYIQDLEYNEEKPTIKLNGNSIIYLNVGDKYTEYGATASDICDGNLSKSIITTGSVDSNIIGEYVITYKVEDSEKNTASINRKVIVQEKAETSSAKNGIIYLTFDDGPGVYTEKILDILESNNIKATFFVTNQLGSKYQYIIKKEYEAGHTVGIHTYSHKWTIYNTVEAYMEDFEKIREIIVAQTGVEPKYFRFPGGTSNHVAKISMKELSQMMLEKGYIYFDWSLSVEDAGTCTKKKGDEEKKKCVYGYFKAGLKDNKANIVLMHDIKKSTLEALPDMISYAKSKGYTFAAIDASTPLKQFAPYK